MMDTTHCSICHQYFPDEPSESDIYSVIEISCDPDELPDSEEHEIMVLCPKCWARAVRAMKEAEKT